MKTTSYICDICKKSVSEKDLVLVEVKVENICFETTNGYRRRNATLDICKGCLRKKGFTVEPVTKDTEEEIAAKNTKTLENKIIDFLEDLGVAFQE